MYHARIIAVDQLNADNERVYKGCFEANEIRDSSWFVLDPIVSHYYKRKHPTYYNVPPFSKDCQQPDESVLAIIYPQNRTEVIIPKNFNGQFENVIVEATHTSENAKLFWHLDNNRSFIKRNKK